ncbi:gas vesicle protein GvpJ [Streptomyces fragilis]|uniref:Gas vesicle protein A n=1 Tax=Streptomyces fragilis TaxID=67301 RepID=A0ABV2YLL1_9ACTN|nr:gas vesicle protein GvpJ [Streptomyces fragilis]
MTVVTPSPYADELACVPRAGTLYDVLDLILDRGMVIDVFVRVSLVGIEIIKIDARIVVASVDTYLRFAEACNRLDLERTSRSKTVPELFGGGAVGRTAVKAGARKAGRSLGDKVRGVLGTDAPADEDAEDAGYAEGAADEDLGEEEYEERPRQRRRRADDDRRRPAGAARDRGRDRDRDRERDRDRPRARRRSEA